MRASPSAALAYIRMRAELQPPWSPRFWTQILNNPTCKHITSWSEDGRYLIIYDTEALMHEIKGRSVCKQKDYDSFARQLRVSLKEGSSVGNSALGMGGRPIRLHSQIYRWGRCRVDDTGASPWPSDAKVWRHPILVSCEAPALKQPAEPCSRSGSKRSEPRVAA